MLSDIENRDGFERSRARIEILTEKDFAKFKIGDVFQPIR